MTMLTLVMLSLCSAFAQGSPQKLRAAVDTYLDRRWDGTAAETKRLVRRLDRENIDVGQLETMLRAGRTSYPPPPVEPGKTKRFAMSCDNVDYDTSFLLFVPKQYDAKKSWPLVLVGHGGNGEMSQGRAERTAQLYHRAWLRPAARKQLIVATPATGRGWGAIGYSILFTVISRLSRELHIDPNRIYATGQSMGGHMSWRCGISLADRWGAISPQSGGYDYVANKQVFRLFNVPGYATHGEREPYQIADFNRKIRAWMVARKYPWVIVEKKGRGHEIFQDELPKVADFFAAHPRDLYRDRVYVHAGKTLKLSKADKKRRRWPKAHTWRKDRAFAIDTFHWVRVLPLPKQPADDDWNQRAMVERVSSSKVKITSRGVRRLRLYLHPKQFDFSKKLEVTANGRSKLFTLEPSLATMLELAREFDDRGRLFHAAIEVEIQRDAEAVPEPRYDR